MSKGACPASHCRCRVSVVAVWYAIALAAMVLGTGFSTSVLLLGRQARVEGIRRSTGDVSKLVFHSLESAVAEFGERKAGEWGLPFPRGTRLAVLLVLFLSSLSSSHTKIQKIRGFLPITVPAPSRHAERPPRDSHRILLRYFGSHVRGDGQCLDGAAWGRHRQLTPAVICHAIVKT